MDNVDLILPTIPEAEGSVHTIKSYTAPSRQLAHYLWVYHPHHPSVSCTLFAFPQSASLCPTPSFSHCGRKRGFGLHLVDKGRKAPMYITYW